MFRLILLSLGQLDKTLHLTTTHKTHEGLLLFKYTPYFFKYVYYTGTHKQTTRSIPGDTNNRTLITKKI